MPRSRTSSRVRRGTGDGEGWPRPRRTRPIGILEARRLYEQTNLPVPRIAALMGIGPKALYRRINAWGWRLRRPKIPRNDPPRQPDEVLGETTLKERPSVDLAATTARVLRAVECELDAVTQILRRLAPQASDERERGQRMLASLARTLQEISRTKLPPAGEQDVNDRGPDDDDEFVQELVRRMDEFARRGQAIIPADAAGEDA